MVQMPAKPVPAIGVKSKRYTFERNKNSLSLSCDHFTATAAAGKNKLHTSRMSNESMEPLRQVEMVMKTTKTFLVSEEQID